MFFSEVFDFFYADPSAKIDSWRFLSRQKSKKFCNTITTTYEKQLLAFWPKDLEASIFDAVALCTSSSDEQSESSGSESSGSESSQSESDQSVQVSEDTEHDSGN